MPTTTPTTACHCPRCTIERAGVSGPFTPSEFAALGLGQRVVATSHDDDPAAQDPAVKAAQLKVREAREAYQPFEAAWLAAVAAHRAAEMAPDPTYGDGRGGLFSLGADVAGPGWASWPEPARTPGRRWSWPTARWSRRMTSCGMRCWPRGSAWPRPSGARDGRRGWWARNSHLRRTPERHWSRGVVARVGSPALPAGCNATAPGGHDPGGGVLPGSGGAISCRAMDTTVVAQSAIGALAALIGGLGGAAIATRPQRSNEQRRQRERAAEVLGLIGPLLVELDPDPMLLHIPPVQPGQPDPMQERFARIAERVRTVGEHLSTLAGWWPTRRGSDLAEQLQEAISMTASWDVWAVRDLRANRDFRDARNEAATAWAEARSLANQLRAEVRGEAVPARGKLLLPVHPESWPGRT